MCRSAKCSLKSGTASGIRHLFNAKEFDEETGLYYYGARYYDPRLSLWISTDPLQEKYPHINSYCYTANNPILFVDPDGKAIIKGAVAAFKYAKRVWNVLRIRRV